MKPNLSGLARLRFLTTTDFPPFSFIDRDKRLVGFHVDLARAICRELEVEEVCQIQAVPFETLEWTLNRGAGDAAMAGLAITPQSRDVLTFSRPYFHLPGRFIAKKTAGYKTPLASSLAGKMVGIVDGSAHGAFAKAYFGDINLRLFDTMESALGELEKGGVEAVFSGGLALSFWMQAKGDKLCCKFIGGPHFSETYFGRGLSVAVRKGNIELSAGLDFALKSISDKGIFSELYLRWFPISLF